MTIKKSHVTTSMTLQSTRDENIARSFVRPIATSLFSFPTSIYLGLGSPTVLYLLTQLKKQSVDRLRPALFFADARHDRKRERISFYVKENGGKKGLSMPGSPISTRVFFRSLENADVLIDDLRISKIYRPCNRILK